MTPDLVERVDAAIEEELRRQAITHDFDWIGERHSDATVLIEGYVSIPALARAAIKALASQSDASPPLVGVEGLREAATTLLGACYVLDDTPDDTTILIPASVASFRRLREALSRVSGDAR